MSFDITVEGGKTVRLPTAGKYCDRDIVVTATGGGGAVLEDELITHTLSIAEYSNDRVDSIGYGTFYDNKNLTKISAPKVTSIGGYAFYKCTSLESIDATLLKSAGTYAFSYTKLSKIDFPVLETITTYTFSDITVPTTVCLPSLTSAANSSFRNSKGITSVDFAIASKVDNLAFYFCNGLETLILRKADKICTLQNTNALSSTKIANGTGYIYVPRALLEDYKTATNWSSFASQFRAIEDYPDICG